MNEISARDGLSTNSLESIAHENTRTRRPELGRHVGHFCGHKKRTQRLNSNAPAGIFAHEWTRKEIHIGFARRVGAHERRGKPTQTRRDVDDEAFLTRQHFGQHDRGHFGHGHDVAREHVLDGTVRARRELVKVLTEMTHTHVVHQNADLVDVGERGLDKRVDRLRRVRKVDGYDSSSNARILYSNYQIKKIFENLKKK